MKVRNIFVILMTITSISFVASIGCKKVISEKKSIIIKCPDSSRPCGYKVFKIIGDTVQIDTCFDNLTNVFTADKTALVTDNPLFSQILTMTSLQWKQMEIDLDNIKKCDYAVPFKIEIAENNRTDTYSLKRFMNCYSNSTKKIMESLDKYFAQL